MKSNALRLLAFSSVVVLLGAGLSLAGVIGSPGTLASDLQMSSHPITAAGQPPRSVAPETSPSHAHERREARRDETRSTSPRSTSAPSDVQPTTAAPPTVTEGVVTTSTAVGVAVAPQTTVATSTAGTVLTGEVSLTNPVVNAGGSLVFAPAANTTLHVTGNLTVLGNLVMHPNSDIIHRIVFEDRGEMIVTEGGLLDIQGTPKVAWNRIGSDPSWHGGDELIVAPISPGDWSAHPFSMGSAVPTYQGYVAEVANLTRNVIIDNPARVMLHGLDGHAPQVIRYATISNAGVRDKLGFYALHFHLNGNATRGSIVEGVVVRDSHFRAFVPHGSHGITFRDTLAVNVVAQGYWWDLNKASDPPSSVHESNDIVYERAGVIGLTPSDPPDQGRQAGFNLGDGNGNVVRNSFVAGVNSGTHNSGFQWPSGAHSVWTAQNLVSHNNNSAGFFVWQNDAEPHLITGVDAFLNGGSGISQGAYSNSYHWVNARLVGNAEGVFLNTFSKSPPLARQTFECVTITDSPLGVVVDNSPADDGIATLFTNLVIQRVGQDFVETEKALAQGQHLNVRVELVAYQTPC